MTDTWLTVKEVAQYLKLSPDLIYKLAQQGKIPASKVGTAWRFRREKIDRWMEAKEKRIRRPNRQVVAETRTKKSPFRVAICDPEPLPIE
ncbi:MAG: helix-turn-helix domain-containing protein [Deltaproteobacteria bacterium]|nr:helix-turn-helix domain-containing protein [Deltaproteobacteria bacterium]